MENGTESKVRKILFNEISFVVAVIGVIIGCFIFLTEPNNANELAIGLQHERITTQGILINDLTKIQQNDIQEVKGELVGLRKEVQALTNGIVRLETIIAERIPLKF